MADSKKPRTILENLGGPDADTTPFRALLAAWSFIVVVLAVAGFSVRWTYYYNFGLQNLVLDAPLTSLPVSAIEIIRNTDNIFSLLLLGVEILIPFQLLLFAIRWAVQSHQRYVHLAGVTITHLAGLDSPFVIDVVRAGLIVYIAFIGGGTAGIRDFRANVVEATSALPKVTAILLGAQSDTKQQRKPLPLTCDTRSLQDQLVGGKDDNFSFIGDPRMIEVLTGGDTCSANGVSWRLLYRDDRYVYIFKTTPTFNGIRPETLVIPNSGSLTLAMQ